MEYCGEVVNQSDFKKRMETYGKKRTRHYYFMTISKDEIIDAHNKGNLSRFINHSCEPNCETQKVCVDNSVLKQYYNLHDYKLYFGSFYSMVRSLFIS